MRVRDTLFLVFTIAVLLRCGAAFALRDFSAPPDRRTTGADGVEYNALGMHVAAGDGYSVDGRQPTSFRPPGFPLFLSVLTSC